MAKGIIYVMTTVVPGIIKIGKAGIDNFESRMYTLEKNGYSNVAGLKRRFAIKVDEYDEKERLLDEIFSKSRVPNTELFALDVDLVIQLLSSFDGEQIYPEEISKNESFKEATRERQGRDDWDKIPDGIYHLSETRKGFGKIEATMRVEEGAFIVEKGSVCAPCSSPWPPEARKSAPIKDNILQADVSCNSPSTAGWVAMGKSNNGWLIWKDEEDQPIDRYRDIESEDKKLRERQGRDDWDKIPDGLYTLTKNVKGFGKVTATMRVKTGEFIVQKGSVCVPVPSEKWVPAARRNAYIVNNTLKSEVSCNSPSTAGRVVLGKATNGWAAWKDEKGRPLDYYRNKTKNTE